MSSKRSWSFRRPHVPSPTSNAAPSGSAHIGPSGLLELPRPLNQTYPDYLRDQASGSHMDAAIVVASVLSDILTFPPGLATPLTQVTDIVLGTIDAVKLMRDNREESTHLVTRVVRFVRSLIDNLKASNLGIADHTPTAANLFALTRCVFHCHCASAVSKCLV